MKTVGSGKAHGTAGASMKKGLHAKEPSSSDASTRLKMSPSVNSGATRDGTAETPATIGPRTA